MLRITSDSNNRPDPIPCTVNICGQTVAIYKDLPKYGAYQRFDLHTAAWIRESKRLIDFKVWVLVPQNKHFAKSILPSKGTMVNTHSIIIGLDKDPGYLTVILKEYSLLQCLGVAESEASTTPEPPQKKAWKHPDPVLSSPSVPAPRAEIPIKSSTSTKKVWKHSELAQPPSSDDPITTPSKETWKPTSSNPCSSPESVIDLSIDKSTMVKQKRKAPTSTHTSSGGSHNPSPQASDHNIVQLSK